MWDGHDPCGRGGSDTPSPGSPVLALFLKHHVEISNGRLGLYVFNWLAEGSVDGI